MFIGVLDRLIDLFLLFLDRLKLLAQLRGHLLDFLRVSLKFFAPDRKLLRRNCLLLGLLELFTSDIKVFLNLVVGSLDSGFEFAIPLVHVF